MTDDTMPMKDVPDVDDAAHIREMHEEILNIRTAQTRQGETLDSLTTGVNTIGTMMNEVVEMFGKVMEQVQKGGIGALLGGMMGGKKNDN